jgi:adenylate cyclase
MECPTQSQPTSRAQAQVDQALAASPRSPLAHFVKGHVLRAQLRWEEALPEYDTVIAFDRNWVSALACIGQCKVYTEAIEDAIPLVEQAIRLSPRDPQIGLFY